jgi:hypothetical protein
LATTNEQTHRNSRARPKKASGRKTNFSSRSCLPLLLLQPPLLATYVAFFDLGHGQITMPKKLGLLYQIPRCDVYDTDPIFIPSASILLDNVTVFSSSSLSSVLLHQLRAETVSFQGLVVSDSKPTRSFLSVKWLLS